MNPQESVLPPPLPAPEIIVEKLSRRPLPGHWRTPVWLFLATGCAAGAADVALYTGDGFGGYGVAFGTALVAATFIAVRRDWWAGGPVLWALLAANALASAWVGSGLSAFLAPAILLTLACRPTTEGELGASFSPFVGLALWFCAMKDGVGAGLVKIFGRKLVTCLAGAAMGGLFLALLCGGNAALGKYVGDVGDDIFRLMNFRNWPFGRFFLWGFGVASFGLLVAPRRRKAVVAPVAEPAVSVAPMAFAALVGTNLAFLASNLVDTWWIGFCRAAPAGVSTTDYLHNGTYALMADAALAGLVLLRIFRATGAARGDRRARALGFALAAQCAWLGLGVAGRLALQVDRFGYTPNRIRVALFLLWGFAGLVGVIRYLRRNPSFAGFTRFAAWSSLGLLSVVQFRPPEVLATDLNLAGFRSHPDWSFDQGYYADGWRLSRAILTEEPASPRAERERSRKQLWTTLFTGDGERIDGIRKANWRVHSLHDDALTAEWLRESPALFP